MEPGSMLRMEEALNAKLRKLDEMIGKYARRREAFRQGNFESPLSPTSVPDPIDLEPLRPFRTAKSVPIPEEASPEAPPTPAPQSVNLSLLQQSLMMEDEAIEADVPDEDISPPAKKQRNSPSNIPPELLRNKSPSHPPALDPNALYFLMKLIPKKGDLDDMNAVMDAGIIRCYDGSWVLLDKAFKDKQHVVLVNHIEGNEQFRGYMTMTSPIAAPGPGQNCRSFSVKWHLLTSLSFEKVRVVHPEIDKLLSNSPQAVVISSQLGVSLCGMLKETAAPEAPVPPILQEHEDLTAKPSQSQEHMAPAHEDHTLNLQPRQPTRPEQQASVKTDSPSFQPTQPVPISYPMCVPVYGSAVPVQMAGVAGPTYVATMGQVPGHPYFAPANPMVGMVGGHAQMPLACNPQMAVPVSMAQAMSVAGAVPMAGPMPPPPHCAPGNVASNDAHRAQHVQTHAARGSILGDPPANSRQAGQNTGNQGSSSSPTAQLESKVWIQGLSSACQTASLQGYLGSFGVIWDCAVVKDKVTDKCNGWGFVRFGNPEAARRVLSRSHTFQGQQLTLHPATEMEADPNFMAKVFHSSLN